MPIRRPLLAVSLAAIAFAVTGSAQVPEAAPSDEATKENRFSSYIALPSDSPSRLRLQAARDFLKEKDYRQAVPVLQAIFDAAEDSFVAIPGEAGKETWVGIRREANRLLASCPKAGLDEYESVFGDKARAILNRAKASKDLDLLADVVRRFLHTAAGAEALDILGSHHLDRGRYESAADCFRRRLERRPNQRIEPWTLLKAIQAFQQIHDPQLTELAWQQLSVQAPKGVQIGGRLVPLEELMGLPPPRTTEEWRIPGLEQAWRKPTAREAVTRDWLKSVRQEQDQRGRPALPGTLPVVADGKLIYRSHQGIEAVDLRTGLPAWESTSRLSLDRLVREATELQILTNWVQGYLSNRPAVLVESSVVGMLTTDRQRVFAVEDLEVPPYLEHVVEIGGFNGNFNGNQFGRPQDFGAVLNDTLLHNRLCALDLATGKVIWELGGKDPDDPLDAAFFLGPPLPMAGKLYALIDRKQELRLVCLDPADGKLLWSQSLGMPATAYSRIARDVRRRTQAAQFIQADGLLICSTNCGAVFAFDPLGRELVWACAYREDPPPVDREMDRFGRRRLPRLPLAQAINLDSFWPSAPPLIHDGHIILAAPDDPAIHCLDLRTGVVRWKTKRVDSDLFLAGAFGERVLLIGAGISRTLSLADGRSEDAIDTGLPSGRGILVGRHYHLPSEDHICTIDIATGRLEKVPTAALGNLWRWHDQVIAQDGSGVALHSLKSDK